MKSISKILQNNQRNIEGKGSVQASKSAKGKDKVAAPRKPVVQIGLGIAVDQAMRAAGVTTRERLLDISRANKVSQEQALKELQQCRDKARKDAQASDRSDIGRRKGRSIDALYARPIAIVRAFIKGENVDKIVKAENMHVMYAFATKGGSKHGDATSQLQPSGFSTWDAKLDRVCLKQDDTDALARLEKHFLHCVKVLTKFEHVVSPAVKPVLKMFAKVKPALRRAA